MSKINVVWHVQGRVFTNGEIYTLTVAEYYVTIAAL